MSPRWRSYRIKAGGRPVKGFTDALTDDAAAAVVAAMRELAGLDLSAARHLRLFARSSPSALAPASTRRVDCCLFRPPKGAPGGSSLRRLAVQSARAPAAQKILSNVGAAGQPEP